MHVNIYMHHMKSLAKTIQQGALCMYLTYITEKVWLPQSKSSSHSQYAKWAYRPTSFVYITEAQLPTTSTSPIIDKYVPETNISTNWVHIPYVLNA